MAGRLQLAADVAVIVDFTIEGDDESLIGRMHRLRAAGAEIDDGKSPLAQRHAAFGLDPDFTGVRPAMPHRLDHGMTDGAQGVSRRRRAPIHHPGNAAHSQTPEYRSRWPRLVSLCRSFWR